MLCTVTNNSKAPQVVTDSKGRDRTVLPTTTKELDLSEKTVDRLRSNAAIKIKVHGVSEVAAEPTAVKTETKTSGDGGKSGQAEVEKRSDLINRYQNKNITFGEFQEEAKVLLGDKWPGGTPRKTVILELLRE